MMPELSDIEARRLAEYTLTGAEIANDVIGKAVLLAFSQWPLAFLFIQKYFFTWWNKYNL